MSTRPRTWLAAPGAILLVLAVSGAVLGANVLVTGPAPEEATDPLVIDTTASWEDVDGNGIDDDCQELVEANPEAALAAFTAADADGDGTLSVTEVAHTDWVGGKNCNHGGAVSDAVHAAQEVAKAARDAAKAERAAARDAAKAERSAERAAAKAERDAAKAERKASAPKPGKGNGGG